MVLAFNQVGPIGSTGATGGIGTTGTIGATGATGARGPSDVYEVASTNNHVTGSASTPLTLTLSALPAGAYAISGTAVFGTPTAGLGGGCTLTAETDSDFASQAMPTGFFATLATHVTHTFSGTGSVSMQCQVTGGAWVAGSLNGDWRIAAVRVNSQTAVSAAIG
jgi:collagen type VII alpha